MTWDSETIMVVVEENYFMRQLLVDTLASTGAGSEKIRSFANCAEVRAFLREEACTDAVVICDIAMQEGNGFEIYESVRAQAPDLKFVFIVAPHRAGSDRRVEEHEGMNILEKPFTPAALAAAVHEVSDEGKARAS